MPFRKPVIKDSRTVREQVSELAYRLWQARGRPLGSPEVDWLRAERLVRQYGQESPFDEFLRQATKALNSTTVAHGVRDEAEYSRVIEERRYLIDVLDRVEMLAFAYSRLKSLPALYRDAETQMNGTKHVTREDPLTWETPEEIAWQRDHWALEARVLVAFVYYELTSLAHMLAGLKVRLPPGELQYLVRARDKFLAHPMFGKRVRNAHGAMSIPQVGLLHPHAIYVSETDPVLLNHYRTSFGLKNATDQARLRDQNEKLILSGKRNCDFSPDEQLRLKAFGIREPDLEASLEEMADILMIFLPEVERISARPIPSCR